MNQWPALLRIAVDLTRSLAADDRYQRLLAAVRSALPCDATALLARRGDELVPLATHGLGAQVMGMRFALADHPRLAAIARSQQPIRFPADSPLPDPFDGLVAGAPDALAHVHDCLGCPLVVDHEVIGVLTADALDPGAFEHLDPDLLIGLGALAGAALRTTHLIDTISALAEKRGRVVRELTRDLAGDERAQLIGVSEAMDNVRAEIDTVAASDLAVLLLGETGVGKERAARAVHARSRRREAPLIHVNCAALPETIVESELFGHVRGSFTGATGDRPGKFEIADGGTLFLDEIGELKLDMQVKLLRALQEGEIQRVGSDRPMRVDVRVVAATNRDLTAEVAAGRFRADLYHRLAVYPITIPPLRERRDDIGVLAGYLLDQHRTRVGAASLVLEPGAMAALIRCDWPGNVRELDHVLARAALRATARARGARVVAIRAGDLDLDPSTGSGLTPARGVPVIAAASPGQPLPLATAVDDFKRALIARVLGESQGNWAEAARRLGMHRSNLHHMAARLGLHS
ncbi:MAG TPA: nitric oxide reductase transcriptional regulator NorR [Kofleriaceae bacterium]|nr:nitric oxide reductase transcriptional regulator NorR [Kofleriaceae bacterium]